MKLVFSVHGLNEQNHVNMVVTTTAYSCSTPVTDEC